MNINYEYYRIFYHVAKCRNLTQAAELLHNNQPNVSRIIKLLEHELGCRLMVRSNRGISLTPEGEQLYSHVKVAVEQLQTAEEEIHKFTEMQKGSVTIGASETALCMHVLPVLNQFKHNYPGIRIRILNHLTIQAIESVKNGSVEFAVVTTPADIEKPLISTPILEYQDIVIGGSAYKQYKDKTITLTQLTEFPLVCLGENSMTYRHYEGFYHRHGLELKPELEAATTDQIIPMIKHNLGVGYLPEAFASDALKNGEIIQIHLSEEIPPRQICFVENEHFPLSVAAKELKRLLIAHRP